MLSLVLVIACMVCISQVATANLNIGNINSRSGDGNVAKWRSTPHSVLFRNCLLGTLHDTYENAVNSAMGSWNAIRDTDGSQLVYLSSTTDSDATDQYLIMGDSLPLGTIARVYYTSCTYYNDAQFVYVQLNTSHTWSDGAANGCYDVQTILVHEFGHVVGLSHCHEIGETCIYSNDDTFVMYPYGYTFYTKRLLKENDASRYRSLY